MVERIRGKMLLGVVLAILIGSAVQESVFQVNHDQVSTPTLPNATHPMVTEADKATVHNPDNHSRND